MKRILIFVTSLLVAVSAMAESHATKPTLMVVPSDAWCSENGYVQDFDNQGTVERIPDYKRALQSDQNLMLAISKINDMMADRGFPLKDLESNLKSIANRTAEMNVTTSKSGSTIAQSPLDMLKNTAKADIIIQLGWSVSETGPKKTLTYILRGLDSYTDKQIAGASGSGAPSMSSEVPVLLEEAVVDKMDEFTGRLEEYFNDLFDNGREGIFEVRVFDNGSGLDLESEFGGTELSEIIDDWMHQNTVEHRYSQSEASENYMLFEQVRMPLMDEKGKAMTAKVFADNLRKYLKQTYQIESKTANRGLGRAYLIIGEK
ncbi:MAG: DUF6175 family protein [Paludibacteraceae bacterium]|nr:DUF6175 family protein [Paludibacteraceae bacterium]